MKRVICWFSCGAASAVATKLAIAQYAGYNDVELIVARCVVRDEHPDNDRFADDCERWFGAPVVRMIAEKYDGSVWNVMASRKYISGVDGAPCTMLLKKQVRIDFQQPTDKHIFGYCSEELDRWNDFLDANNIDAESPLMDRGITHANCLAMVQNAGIELPEMYKLGYQHNNCIGCVKSSGAGYWNKIRKDFPDRFWRMAGASRVLGVKMIQITKDKVKSRIYLDELEPNTGRYQDEPEIQCGVFCELGQKEYAKETP